MLLVAPCSDCRVLQVNGGHLDLCSAPLLVAHASLQYRLLSPAVYLSARSFAAGYGYGSSVVSLFQATF